MSQGAASPPQAQMGQEEAVLGEVLLQQRSRRQAAPGAEPEDPDLALAKLLQAQEQVWMAMAGAGSGVLENVPPAAAGSPGVSGQQGSGQEGTGGGGVAEEEEELTDEEMARRLQEQEEREFQQRMLALAGMGAAAPGGGGGGADSADADAAREAEYFTEDEVDPDDMTYEELSALGEAVGTVSKGLTQAQFEALPQQQFFEVASAAAGTEEEQCPICRVEYEPEDIVKVLPRCKHYGHPNCLAEWLKRNKVCCICNTEVVEDVKQARAGDADVPAAGASGGVLGERRLR